MYIFHLSADRYLTGKNQTLTREACSRIIRHCSALQVDTINLTRLTILCCVSTKKGWPRSACHLFWDTLKSDNGGVKGVKRYWREEGSVHFTLWYSASESVVHDWPAAAIHMMYSKRISLLNPDAVNLRNPQEDELRKAYFCVKTWCLQWSAVLRR
jgi:hypothetical protein